MTSWGGLAILPKTEDGKLTIHEWVLAVTGSLSVVGGCCLADGKSDDWTLEDSRGSRSSDVHTHGILDASFDQKLAIVAKDVEEVAQRVEALDKALVRRVRPLRTKVATVAEKEQQARYALIARLSDMGTDSNPVDALQGAIRICSDTRLWECPARAVTVHIDTQQFYIEGKIWPTIRDKHIVWSLDPDYDPPDGTEEIEQTPFRPFRCCIWCKYISKHYDGCAVVPFGCGTGDRSEECREFESKDGNSSAPEPTFDDIPF